MTVPSRRDLLLSAGGATLLLAGPASVRRPALGAEGSLLVFAAASLKNALDNADRVRARQGGGGVTVSYAASSALARQIEAGAPADIFISADLAWMDYLDKRHLIRPETRTDLVSNELVLVAPAVSGTPAVTIAPGFPLAQMLKDGRLAVADPRAVPAGRYAKAALETLGVWKNVVTRLAPAEDVRAALRLVARGEAPLGIVYATDAAAEPGVRIVGRFPQKSHPPIVYPAAIVASSTKAAAASAYLAFLKSPAARRAFVEQGFAIIK